MKARLKIAYSDEAWSMIGEIEGRKSVRLKDSHIKGQKHYVPQMTWYSAQEGVASLPVGDQECYRYLYLSWKTDAKLPLSAVLLREYIIDHFWEYVRFTANSTYPME